jgi:HD-GYP domain-containing protein (c-di-GMP phosphodiesterase class II)
VRLQRRTHARFRGVEDLLAGLTRSLTAALDAKDPSTYGHSERVARVAVELGRELGLPADDLSDVYLAGLLHDVGKIGVSDSLLSKREPLTTQEAGQLEQHVTIGYDLLAELAPIRHLLPGVLYHHERWDGRGFPDGLAGEAIPRLARILAVADAYDALCTSRYGREAMPYRRAEEVLAEGAGVCWDPEVIAAFARARLRIHAIRQRGVGESLCVALEGALDRQAASVCCPEDEEGNASP